MLLTSSQGVPGIAPVITDDLDVTPWYLPREWADHKNYPNPQDYTVRIHRIWDMENKCACTAGCVYDRSTRDAEVLCKCKASKNEEADYVGESEDRERFYMADELKELWPEKALGGLFGGNPYNC
jgi:hypothetical protein